MKNTVIKSIALGLAGLTMAAGPMAASAQTIAERGEARLAQMLEGREAGTPVACISAMRDNRLQVIDRVGLVYDAGDTIYVARVDNPNSLNGNDVPIIERFGSQLCRYDVRRTVDRYNGFVSGAVFLQDFVPYTKKG